MAKISLRAYNKEIESLVDRGQYEQALAHCRHILKYYPKHIDTYRLMAKAYMEAQRYGDASDVFQRVLSSVPDDFVSHLGMSIIREDEGNLDAAIWHMERAFEIQPANGAIQSELRRLYGRRDGIEPPKVRLTRGALARMYFKGELYQQAINELRSALAADPSRTDLQLLLAQCYFRSNQRVDAADICTAILKKLPYCIEANRILYEILASSERSQDAPAYRQRAVALNPYLGQLSPKSATPEKVSDEAVAIEKLEWTGKQEPGSAPEQPQWASSLGIQIDAPATKSDDVPDWLSALDAITQSSTTEQPADAPKVSPFTPAALASEPDLAGFSEKWETNQETDDKELIPDWMKDAGWAPSSETTQEAEMGFNLTEQDDLRSQELSPAEIPSWLKEIAPKEAFEQQDESDEEIDPRLVEALDSSALPWLEETPPGPSDTIAAWLIEKEVPAAPESAAPQEALPDWMNIDEAEAGSALGAAMPGFDSSEPGELAPVIGTGVPDWLLELEKDIQSPVEAETHLPDQGEELPDWLKAEEETSAAEISADMSERVEEQVLEVGVDEIPSIADEPSPETIEAPPALEVSQPAEVLPIADSFEEPEPASSEVPEWLAKLGPAMVDQESAPADQAAVETPGLSAQEEEAAFAWLEGLAAKQGASEALFLSPEERLDLPPEWVQKEAAAVDIEGEPVEVDLPAGIEPDEWAPEVFEQAEEHAVDITGDAEPALPESLPDWLRQADTEVGIALPVTSEEGTLPDWLRQMEEGEEKLAEEEKWDTSAVEEGLEEPALDWLSEKGVFEEDEDLELAWLSQESSEPSDIDITPPSSESDALRFQFGTPGEEQWQPEELPQAEEAATVLIIEEPPVIAGDTQPARLLPVEEKTPAEDVLFEDASTVPPTAEPAGAEIIVSADQEEMEAAFAWLESLAVRQGAGEALMYTEEERDVEPPEWVQVAATETAAETAEEAASSSVDASPDSAAEEELPIALGGEAPAEAPIYSFQEFEEGLQLTGETDKSLSIEAQLSEAPLAADEFEDITSRETSPLISPEAEEVAAEVEEEGQLLQETAAESEAGFPDLPDWLADLEAETEATGEMGWSPQGVKSPTTAPIDLNEASLIELERLPGIGFVRAQALIDYRNSHGDLTNLDDLTNVAGFDTDVIEGLRDIAVFPEPEPPAVRMPEELRPEAVAMSESPQVVEEISHPLPEGQESDALLEARTSLKESDIQTALVKYQALINDNTLLPEVVKDIHEALYRFPVDISLWMALGDAQMRAGQIQQALDAYTKAEDLLK